MFRQFQCFGFEDCCSFEPDFSILNCCSPIIRDIWAIICLPFLVSLTGSADSKQQFCSQPQFSFNGIEQHSIMTCTDVDCLAFLTCSAANTIGRNSVNIVDTRTLPCLVLWLIKEKKTFLLPFMPSWN